MIDFCDDDGIEDSLAKGLPHFVNQKDEKKFRSLYKQSRALAGIEFVNFTPCSESDVAHIYKTRVNKIKENVKIDEGVLEKKYSPYEVMIMTLLRLSQRFTLEEAKYLEDHHQAPLVDIHQDGAHGKWHSIMSCQKLIKAWKKHRTKEFPIVSDEELSHLDRVSGCLVEDKSNTDEKVFFLFYTPQTVTTLPFLVGCLKVEQVGDLQYFPCIFTVDSAASSSILPLKLFKKLGHKMEDLDQSHKVTVATACSSSTKAVGFFKSRIYLRGQNKRFYWLPVNFLVLDCALEDRVLIGIRDLRAAAQKLDSSGSVETITLSVKNHNDETVRKKFVTNEHLRPGKLSLISTNREFKKGRNDILYTSEIYLIDENKMYRTSCKGGKVSRVILKDSHLKVSTLGRHPYPESITYTYTVRVKSCSRRKIEYIHFTNMSGDLSNWGLEDEEPEPQYRAPPPQEHYGHPAEKPLTCLDPIEDLSVSPDLEGMTIDQMTVGPPDIEVREGKWYLPEMSHLSPYWQEKYEKLFFMFRGVMAKSKYDFCQSNLPPVDIKLKPGIIPKEDACDSPRRFGPKELEIIDHYLANLSAAGHVRALRPDEHSPFNHNLLLVYRQIPGEKAFVSSKADKTALTQAERIEMLSKSCRLCSDLKSLNDCVEPEGAMVLQKFSESLPLFANKVLSSADIKSGFNVIMLTPKSQLYTAFTHRDRQYCYVTLPQGLKTSPPLFQRRLGLALNADNYSLFKAEVNQMLMNKEEHPLLVWDCNNGWEGESPEAEETDGQTENLLRNDIPDTYVYTPVLECSYSNAVQIYMDDLLLMAINQLNDYYTVWFILKYLDKHTIKLAASKFQLSPASVTYLGYQIDTNKSSYGLTAERKRNFKEWKMPTTREILVSRLCTLNYFQSVLGSFKILTQCLHALANTEKGSFHIRSLHRDEWEMTMMLIDCDLTYRIVDLSQPIILQCDASYSSSSGAAFQFLPPAKPRGKDSDKQIKSDCEGTEVAALPEIGLQIIGQFSKRFAKTDVQKNPLYKEVLGLLACVKEFEVYIRNTTAFSVLFTDASSMSFIVKQRHVNSRLANVALYLSSFPNLSVLWTAGGKMNFFSDFMGKQYCGMTINEPGAIPAKYLNAVPQLDLPTTLLNSDTLRALLSAPMPNLYLDIPERRKQAKSDLMTHEDFEKLLVQKPVEVQTLQALLFGLNGLPQDSLAFQRNDKKGLISNTEFETLRRRMDPGELRKRFEYVMTHSHHVEFLTDIKDLCRDWVFSLVRVMESNNEWSRTEPSLYHEARQFLQTDCEDFKQQLLQLVCLYQASSLYNFSYQEVVWHPTVWIACGLYYKSQISIQAEKGRLLMSTKDLFTLKPQEARVLVIGLCFKTKYSITIESSFTDCIFQPIVDTCHLDIEFRQLLIMNIGTNDKIFTPNVTVGQIVFHMPFGENCECKDSTNLRFIIQNLTVYEGIVNPDSPLTVEILLTSTMAGPAPGGQVTWGSHQEKTESCFLTSEALESNTDNEGEELVEGDEGDEHRGKHLAKRVEQDIEKRSKSGQFSFNTARPPMSPQAHNKLVLACLLLTREESVFTPAQFRKLQETDPYLVAIIKKTEKGNNNSFSLINGVLFYTKNNESRLCLDPNTLSMIVRQMHILQRHYNLDSMVQYISSYFFSKNIKNICKIEQEKCSPCFFNTPCRKTRYINNPAETEYPKPWEQINVDLDESFPRSGTQMKYLMLVVDSCTGFIATRAMRRATSQEAVKSLEDIFSHFGPPARLKTDFGPLFRGKEFRQYLSSMNIVHQKLCPKRAQENGQAERNIALYRSALMKILTSEAGNSPKHWYKYLQKCTLLFNSASLYSREGTVLSRFNLFFSHLKYTPSWLVHSNSLSSDIREKQIESMEKLFKIRNDFREKYKSHPNPYELDQVVISPISKDEFPSIDGERGGMPTVMQVFKVIDLLHNGCEVVSLLDSSKSVIDLKDLRPCTVEESENLFNKDLMSLGTFQQGLYRAGNKNGQIFRQLFDKNVAINPPSPDGLNGPMLEPVPTAENVLPENEPVLEPIPIPEDENLPVGSIHESESLTETETPVIDKETPLEVNPQLPLQYNTRYNLRTRKPVTYVYWVEEEPATKWANLKMESLKSILKTRKTSQGNRVNFRDVVTIARLDNDTHLVQPVGMEECNFTQIQNKFKCSLPLDPTISIDELNTLFRSKHR